MFEGIRGRINSVQNELSTSIKRMSITDSKSRIKINDGVNLQAGSELLHHYQTHWEKLHRKSEENSRLADEAAEAIATVHKNVKQAELILEHFQQQMSTLTTVTKSFNEISEDLKILHQNIEVVETALERLEEKRDTEEFEELKREISFHTDWFRRKKDRELQELKVMLAAEHEKKAKEFEKREKLKAEERSQVFQQAFEGELDMFKRFGKVEGHDQKSASESKSLEEVLVEPNEADVQALDDFLAE